MTVFFAKQVFPVDDKAQVSQRLLEACHSGDLKMAFNCIANPYVNVNFVGAVTLKTRCTDLTLLPESASQVSVEFQEIVTDVTPLFLAVHAGNESLVRTLVIVGADVNQKLFRGFATTAAVWEGDLNMLEILLKAGASRPACEEALLEASYHGQSGCAELLMSSYLIRPHVAVHALVNACCRGFVDVVETLIKCGVDASATDRVLLQSVKPSLYTTVNCTALVAAVIHRQVPIVALLLQNGARINFKVKLGAWSWDTSTGEELRVGAGLGEPYDITWCAVEYFETSGAILRLLLQHFNSNSPHRGRTLLHHAILCGNVEAARILLECGANVDSPVKLVAWSWDTSTAEELRVGAAGLGEPFDIAWCAVEYFQTSGDALRLLLQHFTSNNPHGGRTLLNHAIRCGNDEAARILIECGVNVESPVKTSSRTEFLPIHMASRLGLPTIIQCLIDFGCDLNSTTDSGDTALMICAKYKQEECLKVLTRAGADFGLVTVIGQSASSIAESNNWSLAFQQAVLDTIRKGKIPKSSNTSTFSPLMFVAQAGDTEALKTVIESGVFDLDYQDDSGFTAVMLTALMGPVESFRLLVYAGADVKLCSKSGETAITLSELNPNHDLFQKIMLEFALEKGNRDAGGFYALHCAARRGDLDAVTLLASKGYDVNVPDGEDYTPLMLATSGDVLRLLLQHFTSNNPHRGRTLLNHAIRCGNDEAARILIECGVNVESPVKTSSRTEFLPIHMASRLGLPTIIQCLIDFGCDLNSTTDSGDTALMICAKYKQEECLKVLTRAGADFGLVTVIGQSASSIADSNNWSLAFQQAVLDTIRKGKIPKSSNTSTFSPLMFVAQAGDTEALKTVIESGVFDLDYQDDSGFTAVMLTALMGHVESFRLLVYAGADVKLCSKSGETAITLSELNPNHDLFEKIMLEFTLEKGNRDAGGFYALHCAARRGDLDAVTLLANKGYDVNVPDGEDYTPLMLAAREGHASICELLISRGAHCNAQNARGETARKLAGGKNNAEAVILDELARKLVLGGDYVQKHTKGGKGSPHGKQIRMLRSSGVLSWGKSRRRNVVCCEAELGPSSTLRRIRYMKADADEPGLFRVLTNKNREVHFVCDGGLEVAELWVRGIKLVTTEAIFRKQRSI